MSPSAWLSWSILIGVLTGAFTVDQLVRHGATTRPTIRRAAIEAGVWTALGLGFTGVVVAIKGWTGGIDYVTGYTLEKSLSLDNVAVFAVIVAGLRVPAVAQRRLIDHAILAALLLRLVFILGGLAALDRFHQVLSGFAIVLVVSGVRMFRSHAAPAGPKPSRILGALGRLQVSQEFDGARYLTRRPGSRSRRVATPMLVGLLTLAVVDVVFAIDSVPAIFAVTSNSWIVCAANAFALLGLRPMYFLLAEALDRLAYLQRGLAVILIGVGTAMFIEDFVEVPVLATLAFVVSALTISVVCSLRQAPSQTAAAPGGSSGADRAATPCPAEP